MKQVKFYALILAIVGFVTTARSQEVNEHAAGSSSPAGDQGLQKLSDYFNVSETRKTASGTWENGVINAITSNRDKSSGLIWGNIVDGMDLRKASLYCPSQSPKKFWRLSSAVDFESSLKHGMNEYFGSGVLSSGMYLTSTKVQGKVVVVQVDQNGKLLKNYFDPSELAGKKLSVFCVGK